MPNFRMFFDYLQDLQADKNKNNTFSIFVTKFFIYVYCSMN